MERKYLSPKELSEFTGISIHTIYSWVSQKKIPFIKVGRLVKFEIDEIREWLNKK